MKRFLRHFGEDGILRRDIGEMLRERKQQRKDNEVLSRARAKARLYDLQRRNEMQNECEYGKVDDHEANRILGVKIDSTWNSISEIEFHYNLKQWIVSYWGRADFPVIVKKIIDGDIRVAGHINNEQRREIEFLRWLFVNNVNTLCNTYENDEREETIEITSPRHYQFDDVGILDVDDQKRQTRMKYVL